MYGGGCAPVAVMSIIGLFKREGGRVLCVPLIQNCGVSGKSNH